MRIRRILLWGTAIGLLSGAMSAHLPAALGHDEGGVRSPTLTDVESMPDLVPALDSEGNVVACIKNPVKYPDDPETLWWPPGLDTTGLVGTYGVVDLDGVTRMVSGPIDVSEALANALALVEAQKGEAKDC